MYMITVVYKLKIKSHLIVLLEQFQHARRHQRLLDGLLLAILSSDGLGFCDISEWHGDRFMARKEDLGVINVGNLIQRNYPYTQVRLSIPIKSVCQLTLLFHYFSGDIDSSVSGHLNRAKTSTSKTQFTQLTSTV